METVALTWPANHIGQELGKAPGKVTALMAPLLQAPGNLSCLGAWGPSGAYSWPESREAILGNHFPGPRIPEVLWMIPELLSQGLIRKEQS